ncbi:hypothetical protein Hamer_G017428 [Homarus americanus]|uniref:Uncharacterized protein n=1 Tax=Homarus americanus TaxID=6706 RepID=A0A8J5JPP3_HOMAM|nr:hypothetical protein Hamer_G017428 [Homarus americanus]
MVLCFTPHWLRAPWFLANRWSRLTGMRNRSKHHASFSVSQQQSPLVQYFVFDVPTNVFSDHVQHHFGRPCTVSFPPSHSSSLPPQVS